MRLAIVLRGISYLGNNDEKVCNSSCVDYRNCLSSFKENILAPLSKRFSEVDIFLVTYFSPVLSNLLQDFAPKDTIIYPKKDILRYKSVITTKLLQDSIHLVQDRGYDNILITRFDLFFYKSPDLSKIDVNKFNFGWVGEVGQGDDNWLLFKNTHIPRLLDHLSRNASPSAHYINTSFNTEECVYLSKLDPANNIHTPDFYYVYRFHDDVLSGKMVLR